MASPKDEQWKLLATKGCSRARCFVYLFELADGSCIECGVFIHNALTHMCVSSQVGCNIGCKHCATSYANPQYVRNVSGEELLSISEFLVSQVRDWGPPLVLSFAGHGEPLLNLDAVRTTCDALSSSFDLRYHVTTVGIRNILEQLLDWVHPQPCIYISLHGGCDSKRHLIVPQDRRICSCDELPEVCSRVHTTGPKSNIQLRPDV